MGVKVRERPKGSGTWWLFIDHEGKRKAKRVGTGPKAKAAADEAAAKIAAAITLERFKIEDATAASEPEIPTFGMYAETWQTTILPAHAKRSTTSDYRGILSKHVLPVFGEKPITEVSRLDVKTFLAGKQAGGLSVSTVTHMKNVIAGVCALAVDAKTIAENPAHRLGKRTLVQKSLRLTADPLSPEELALLLATFEKHYPRHYPLALLLARTGMRRGEAIGLQWGDIDFHGRFITVRRNVARGKVEKPKSGKERRVDMSLQLKATLEKLLAERKAETLAKGWGEVPEWVFLHEDGRRICGTSWQRRIFNPALAKAKLRRVRLHDLRHTYASLLIQNGTSLAYIRDQLGHHSIKVTVDVYGHLVPGANLSAVDALDDATVRNPGATKKTKGATRAA